MFSPVILICVMSGECHTPPAPAFETLEMCEIATENYIANALAPALPPGTFVVKWVCHDWGLST